MLLSERFSRILGSRDSLGELGRARGTQRATGSLRTRASKISILRREKHAI